MIGNDEQKAAYVDALEVEKAGYEKKIETCNVTGDAVGAKRYADRIKQVDAEIKKAQDAPADDDAGEVSLEATIKKAKSGELDAIASELGFAFADDVSTVADKKAALLEHVQA